MGIVVNETGTFRYSNENVNVSFLKQGIYLVKVQTATGLLVVRLVKE